MKKENTVDYDKLNHSCSHLLAAAVLSLYPEAKPTLGPAIEKGFYYDFDFGEAKIGDEDLKRIESEMKKIVLSWDSFEREELSKDEAKKKFLGNEYKLELITEHAGKGDKITTYKSGEFVDLCKGGHVNDAKELKYFKLLRIAGAYWRGDEKNKMLTRIYGTCWETKVKLEAYKKELEEAEIYNHRKIGKELELFEIFNEIGQGLPVWLPNGYAMRRALEDYMIQLERKYGYEHILTPHISREELFKTSGHLGFYDESMYSPIEIEEHKYYLKPMNCPAGMMVFKSKPKSYRDLPMKLGEFGTVYRYEKSGELHGLQRVRGFTQNDAHIFCTKDQLRGEIQEVLTMLKEFYQSIGFSKYKFVLALGDQDKEKFKACGTKEGWEWAENILREVLDKNKIEYEEKKGEAAFYGPKIDVLAVNVYGKADAISTVQIDFNLPERFGLSYVDKNDEKQVPFVVHRALVGSFERFFSFLIEYYKGAFPVWFSPIQAIILPITDKQDGYAKGVLGELREKGFRAKIDLRSETLGTKIREAQMMKIPFMIIVGGREEEANVIAVRTRKGEDLGQVKMDKFLEDLTKLVESRAVT